MARTHISERTRADSLKHVRTGESTIPDAATVAHATEPSQIGHEPQTEGLAPAGDLTAWYKGIVDALVRAPDGKSVTASSPDLPAFPAAMWEKMNADDGSKAALTFMASWLMFVTDRRGQAAWTVSRETRLLAHLESEQERSAAAKKLLKQDILEAQQRHLLMAEAVMMGRAVRSQFSAWTKLAGSVPWILVLSIMVNAICVFAGLIIVSQGRLNGLEMALLAFVFALTAVSPATLLLIGRPLAGLDKWTPDALFNAGRDETENKTGVTKPAQPEKRGDAQTEGVKKSGETEKATNAT